MAFLNPGTSEIFLKILYVGASGSGKTTNLQSIYKLTARDMATRVFDLHGLNQRNPFFDFLPVAYGHSKAYALRLHLYTLPSHDIWETLLLSLVQGLDGVVFVVDSRLSALSQNERHLERLSQLLQRVNRSIDEIPIVYQYNFRDAADAVPLEALQVGFCRADSSPVEAVAPKDKGVIETLETLADLVLKRMESESQVQTPSQAQLDSGSFSNPYN